MRLIEWLASVGRYGLDFRRTDALSKLPTPVATRSEKLQDVTMKTQSQHFTNVS